MKVTNLVVGLVDPIRTAYLVEVNPKNQENQENQKEQKKQQ
jgi:hypothetical protein